MEDVHAGRPKSGSFKKTAYIRRKEADEADGEDEEESDDEEEEEEFKKK